MALYPSASRWSFGFLHDGLSLFDAERSGAVSMDVGGVKMKSRRPLREHSTVAAERMGSLQINGQDLPQAEG